MQTIIITMAHFLIQNYTKQYLSKFMENYRKNNKNKCNNLNHYLMIILQGNSRNSNSKSDKNKGTIYKV
jgi:hypothetical protein